MLILHFVKKNRLFKIIKYFVNCLILKIKIENCIEHDEPMIVIKYIVTC